MPFLTFQTLVPKTLDSFLDTLTSYLAQVERALNARLNKGETFEQVEKKFQISYRLDSQSLRNVRDNLKGKRESRKECLELEISETEDRVEGLTKSITRLNRQLKTALRKAHSNRQKAKDVDKEAQCKVSKLRFSLHQKNRKLHRLHCQLTLLQQLRESGHLPMTFGGSKLFKAQFNLEANGYSSHEEWLKDWRNHRNYNILMVGSKRFEGGNQLCRLDESGRLRITVPPALQNTFGSHVEADGIKFRYGWEYIKAALQPKRYESVSQKTGKTSGRTGTQEPLTHRFVKQNDVWYLHTTVQLPDIPYQSHRKNGMIGVDFNQSVIGWAYCDRQGNLKASGQIRIDIQDKSVHQTKQILGDAVKELVILADTFQCPITVEDLDFAKKKASMKEQGRKYARMLSNFAYSKFYQLLDARCYKTGIELIKKNAAYSSLIGLTKFLSMYGLSSDTAAALVLARRGLNLSERLPLTLTALVAPVDATKHVWSLWASSARKLKGASRHSFFQPKARVRHSLPEVTPLQDRSKPKGASGSG